MNITPKQYAIALDRALVNLDDEVVGDVIRGFVDLLKQNDDVPLWPKIRREFERLATAREQAERMEVEAGSESEAEIARQFFGDEVDVSVNEKLVGGVRITMGDSRIDNSIQARMNALKDALKK